MRSFLSRRLLRRERKRVQKTPGNKPVILGIISEKCPDGDRHTQYPIHGSHMHILYDTFWVNPLPTETLVLHDDLGADIGPKIELPRLFGRQVHASVRILSPELIVPVRPMDRPARLGEIEVPRDAGKIVVLLRNAGNGSLHVTARCLFKNGKCSARRRRQQEAGRDARFHVQFFTVVSEKLLLPAFNDDTLGTRREGGVLETAVALIEQHLDVIRDDIPTPFNTIRITHPLVKHDLIPCASVAFDLASYLEHHAVPQSCDHGIIFSGAGADVDAFSFKVRSATLNHSYILEHYFRDGQNERLFIVVLRCDDDGLLVCQICFSDKTLWFLVVRSRIKPRRHKRDDHGRKKPHQET